MCDFDRILAVKNASKARLLAIPGVHAVGVGAKNVAGRRIDEPAIMVFLLKKKPLSELAPHEIVPSEIEGVKTDIMEVGIPETLAAPELDPDTEDYWVRGSITLMGGMQIQASGPSALLGTLGCIARTSEAPDPKLVAITCQHVVAARPGAKKTLLETYVTPDLAPIPDWHTIKFLGANTPGSLVVATLQLLPTSGGAGLELEAFWTTGENENLIDIAKNVANAINGLSSPGLQATPQDDTVKVTWPAGFIVKPACEVYEPHGVDSPSTTLRSFIKENVITLEGNVSGDYGVYANLNTGGAQPSYGTFTALDKKNDLGSVGSLIGLSINALNIAGIQATAAGSKVTINGAKEVECDITGDVRVGQPTNSFCSKCCWCCNDRIGRVVDARLNTDIALIQLDPGIKYKAEILDIGIIKGSHTITDSEAVGGIYQVSKRGRTTRRTSGTIVAMHVDGSIGALLQRPDGTKGRVFHRHYTDSIYVLPDNNAKFRIEDKGVLEEVLAFAHGGDSGAALVNANNEILGVVFGGMKAFNNNSWGYWGMVTPIEPIIRTFGLSIETATVANVVKTVPAPANVHPFAIVPDPAIGAVEGRQIALAWAGQDRFREMKREITSLPAGRKYAEFVHRHVSEIQALINSNRRVATVWQRSGGPQLVQGLLQMIQRPDQTLPSNIEGKPLSDCLLRIQKILCRYGSQTLSADLSKYGGRLVQLSSLTYSQMLDTLKATVME